MTASRGTSKGRGPDEAFFKWQRIGKMPFSFFFHYLTPVISSLLLKKICIISDFEKYKYFKPFDYRLPGV